MRNQLKKLLRESTELESLLYEIDDEINNELDLSSFKIKNKLNPKIWVGDTKINPEIVDTLITIATDYWNSLELGIEISDINMTGSLANYNWSKFSDVDLHILFDATQLVGDKDFVKDLLDSKTRNWNSTHDITIKGYEVELYLQPIDQPHHSTGVYSLLNNEWVTKPNKQEVKLDKVNIRKKYNDIVNRVNDIDSELDSGSSDSTIDKLERLKTKIKNMRQSGLESGGEYSVENIVFKSLRRNDIMERINDMATKAYDTSMTIKEKTGL